MTQKQFDSISDEFSNTVTQTKRYIRIPTFLKLLGHIQNKTVADFGCGDGFFTRVIAEQNPRTIIGVDFSQPLIDIALQKEKLTHQNINYLSSDIRTLRLNQTFDTIASVYLLDHAESEADLTAMITSIYSHCNNNGRFCSIVPHPNIHPTQNFEYGRRISSITNKPSIEDGDILTCEIQQDGITFKFNFHYWSQQTYTTQLRNAGFQNIEWIEPIISNEGINKYGTQYWENFRKNPSCIGLICKK